MNSRSESHMFNVLILPGECGLDGMLDIVVESNKRAPKGQASVGARALDRLTLDKTDHLRMNHAWVDGLLQRR